MKNVLKNQFLLFKDKQIVFFSFFFFCLRTSKTLSFGEFDESKTHIFKLIFHSYFSLKSPI